MAHFIHGTALIIGIGQYAYIDPVLPAARKDAEDIAALLQDPAVCGYDPAKVRLLLDSNANLASIRSVLADMARNVTIDESFLLYFSGHGHRIPADDGERSYLLTSDSKLSDPGATALGNSELLTLLRALPSQRQVVMLDACHAGGVGTLKSAASGASPLGLAKSALGRLSSGAGRVLLTSSRANEVSWIPAGWHNSLFTDSLIRALRGGAKDKGDGTIGVFDAFNFIAADVPKYASQHPVFKADGLEENFSIARHTNAATLKAPEHGVADPANIVELLASLYPLGPMQSEIWSRAGGDVSRLTLDGHGRARWHSAVQMLASGGGGITLSQLLQLVAQDFPGNLVVKAMLSKVAASG